GKLLFRDDRDALGIRRACQSGRVDASFDVGDLRRGKGDDMIGPILPESDVEVVKIAAGGPHDDDAAGRGLAGVGVGHGKLLLSQRGIRGYFSVIVISLPEEALSSCSSRPDSWPRRSACLSETRATSKR